MSKSNTAGTKLVLNNKVVGGLTSVAGVSLTAETIDISDLSNTTGYREFIASWKDGGEIPVSGFLDGADDGQDECYTLFDSGESTTAKIVFPTKIGKTWQATVSVTAFNTGAEVGGAVTFGATLRVSGKPNFRATQDGDVPSAAG